jgi:hypothetical protein
MDEEISRATPSGWLDMTDSPSIERATPSGWVNVEASPEGPPPPEPIVMTWTL